MSSNTTNDNSNNLDEKVVVQHKILSINECFLYRIPPMKSSGGHRAEDWNLANALATCSLDMIEKDDVLLVNLMSDRPKTDGPKGATEKFLFAQSQMDLMTSEKTSTSYWAEAVVDSSRYFVLRIFNPQTKREATIGIGFRERNDAVNFRMGMQDYERSIQRQQQASQMSVNNNIDANYANEKDDNEDGTSNQSETHESLTNQMSQFSLKEGEKMHIDIKSSKRRAKPKSTSTTSSSSSGGFLLRKPPPPVSANLTNNHQNSHNRDNDESNKNKENNGDEDEEEDEWGDFQ